LLPWEQVVWTLIVLRTLVVPPPRPRPLGFGAHPRLRRHDAAIHEPSAAGAIAAGRICELVTTDVRSFEDLGVDTTVVRALADAGITAPFPIQELSLPMALAGADLIGQARTGTGKTLAFGVPLVQRIDPDAGYTQALVIVPTRELCLQVHDDLTIAGTTRGVHVVAAYGGRSIDPQSEAIAAGASIVVGTPGRLLDLCRRRLLDLSKVAALVLDEADEMLDMGFLPDVEQLIERCPDDRQTLLFSATMPSEVVKLARRYMDKPTFMRTDVEQQHHVAPRTRQHFFACHRLDKPAVVARILAAPGRGRTLIFTRTKRMADVLASELRDRRIDAGVIHSDLRQDARERALAKFRRGSVDVLCATEVAARGLDIYEVTHVINYDCPDDERMYLHRIGRTGRAGAAGVAITLAVWNELARLDMIKRALDIDQPTEEVLSTSPILDDLFGAAEATPRAGRGRGGPRSRRHDGAPTITHDDDGGSGDTSDDETDARGPREPGPSARPERRPRTRRRRATSTAARTQRDATTGAGVDAATATDRSSTTDAPAMKDGTPADARPHAAAPAHAGRDAPATDGPTAVRSPGDGEGDGSSGPTQEDAQRGGTDQGAASTGGGGAGARSGRSSRRSRGSRRSRSGRGDRRSGRADGQRPTEDDRADGRRDTPVVVWTTGDPRGDGRPTLNRPLRITHLP
jgi:superfamily II DNA/RNA helicase